MKASILGLAVAALLVVGQAANAGNVNGSAAIGGFVQGPFTGLDVTTITSFTTTSQLGGLSFVGSDLDLVFSAYTFGIVTVDFTATGLTLSSDVGFGTFTSTAIVNLGSTTKDNSVTQAYSFVGDYTPGTDFTGQTSVNGGIIDATPQLAQVTLSLTQTGGVGQSISQSGTFVTGSSLAPAVPEPTTVLAALLGVVPFVVARRRLA